MKTPEVYKIVGSPKDLATTQVHQFDLKDGLLIVLATLSGSEPNLSRMETIRGVVNFMHHALSDVNFDFELVKNDIAKNVSSPPFDISVIYLRGDNLYLFLLGRVNATLFREFKGSLLLKGEEAVHAVSGKVREGDVICIGTKPFWEVIDEKAILEYIEKGEIKNIELDFEVSVEKCDEHEFLGGVLLTFGQTRVKETNSNNEPLLASSSDSKPAATVSEALKSEDLDEEVAISTEKQSFFETYAPKPRFFVRSEDAYEARGKNKKMTIAGSALLVVLAVCMFFGFRAKKAQDEVKLVKATIQSAQDSLSQARTLSLVNKGKARELIYSAKNQIASIGDKEVKFPEVKGMSDEISDSLGEVGGIYEDSPEVFSDLSLISNDMKADDISISDDVIRVLGRDSKRVITITLPGKKTETIQGSGTYLNPKKVISYADRTFIWEENGIHEYGGVKSTIAPSIQADRGIIWAFANNLYLVDKDANMIYRYSGNESGFSDKSSWLSSDASVDLSKANSMAIDGSIWVLSETGKITKFTLGNPQNVNLQGLDEPLSENSRIFTTDESSSLYILDPNQSAIYVFSKTGEFVAKYANTLLKEATNIVVSESQRIIVVSAQGRLLSLPTKHIR